MEEENRKQTLKTKWAALKALLGSEKRIRLIADDLVLPFELRLEAMDDKAMVVCLNRRICVELYNELIRLFWFHSPPDLCRWESVWQLGKSLFHDPSFFSLCRMRRREKGGGYGVRLSLQTLLPPARGRWRHVASRRNQNSRTNQAPPPNEPKH